MTHDHAPDDPASSYISEARELAATAVMLLEHPTMKAAAGSSGLYETALDRATPILQLTLQSEDCTSAEEFDVLLNLICSLADGLALTLSQLRIP